VTVPGETFPSSALTATCYTLLQAAKPTASK
jgi:hypothetical protein